MKPGKKYTRPNVHLEILALDTTTPRKKRDSRNCPDFEADKRDLRLCRRAAELYEADQITKKLEDWYLRNCEEMMEPSVKINTDEIYR